MSESRIRRIEEILDGALERATTTREAYLADACGGDVELMGEIRSLLSEHRRMGGFLETSAVERLRGALLAEDQEVGGYRIVRVLGVGGGGTVYLAQQAQPQRHVALKVVHAGFASGTAASRFRQEAEILARLQHPAIAHVYEAGVHDGMPYIALEYVEGAETILGFSQRSGLGRRPRIELFARVCDAVHAGHVKGVVHLDLKPGNILVLPSGDPKIIDFGIARVEGMQGDGEVAGTPPYMSPEQGEHPDDLDLRSDVYSLGVVLFELLTGRLPHDVSGLPIGEALHRIREQAPAALDPDVDPDLVAIVMRATASNPANRYATAADLAADLRRFLAHLPVTARPVGWGRQFALWTRRHVAVAIALLAFVLALVTGTVLSTVFALRATEARDRERTEAYLANIAAADAALRNFEVTEARARLAQTRPELRGWEHGHLLANLDRSVASLSAGGIGFTQFDSTAARVVVVERDPDGPDFRVIRTEDGAVLHEERLEEYPQRPAMSSDGRFLAWGDEVGHVELRDGATYDVLARVRPHRDRVYDVAFRSDGRQFASCSHDGTAFVWDSERGAVLFELANVGRDGCYRICFDPSGKRIAIGDLRGGIQLWDVARQELEHSLYGHAALTPMLAFTPDGRQLVSGGVDATWRRWDVESGKQIAVHRDRRRFITAGALTRDGERVVTGHADGSLTVWDLASGLSARTLWGHDSQVHSLQIAPDGNSAFTGSGDGTIRQWDLSGRAAEVIATYEQLARDVTFSPDGRMLATCTFDGAVRLHRLDDPGDELVLSGHRGRVQAIDFNADGTLLASVGADGQVRLWATSGEERAVLDARRAKGLDVAFHPDGRHLVSAHDGVATVWDVETGAPIRQLANPGGAWVWVSEFTNDGAALITGDADGALRIWDWRAGAELKTIAIDRGPITTGEFRRDGRRLAVGAREGVHIVDTRTWEPLVTHRLPAATVQGVSWSSDGDRLAVVGSDVRIIDPASGATVLRLCDLPVLFWDVAFSPEGDRVAAALGGYEGQGCEVRIWSR